MAIIYDALLGNITSSKPLVGDVTSLKLEEIITENFQLIDRGEPGLSAGDMLMFETKLIDPNTDEIVATKNATERYVQGESGDIISIIQETIDFVDGNKLYTLGTFNQTERPNILSFGIVDGTGTFEGAKGFEKVTSVFPYMPGDDQVDNLIDLTFIS